MNNYKLIQLNKGKFSLVDETDYAFLSQKKWYVSSVGYVVANTRENGKQKTLLLHNLLLDSPNGLEVDHINRDKLDNRRENLRLVSHGLNCQNRKSKRISNSGFKGVSKQGNRFMCFITKMNKSIYLGSFKTVEEAASRYMQEKRIIFMKGDI